MIQATFQENPLFHFKPSEVTLEGFLSSMLGLLQARQAFIFPRNKTWPKSREIVQSRDCVLCSEERLCLVESQDICLVETQDMCCVERLYQKIARLCFLRK